MGELAAWARAEAPKVRGWGDVEESASSGVRLSVYLPRECRALVAFRSEVMADPRVMRRVRALARNETPWAYFPKVHAQCADLGVVELVDGYAMLTWFGRHVARRSDGGG